MLIIHYLAKQVFVRLASLIAILLLIFISDQCMSYLQLAVNGKIPMMLLMELMVFELPLFIAYLLPLGFYVALLLTYSHLYTECEITVLHACGYGSRQLLQHSIAMASVVIIIVMILTLWVNPIFAKERAKLIRTKGLKTAIQMLGPERFHAFYDNRQVFYVVSISRDHSHAKQVFWAHQVQKDGQKEWDVLWADDGSTQTNSRLNHDYVVLKNGKEYQGIPGHADYQVTEFERYKKRLLPPSFNINGDVGTFRTHDLLPLMNDLNKIAELQWRLSIPLMILPLTLFGVPLSQVHPRSGKYIKLLPAIAIYSVYSNVIFMAHSWLNTGKTPLWLGMWWPHFVIAFLALLFIWRNHVKLA